MKLLRQIIRQIILEGPVKDSFEEAWHNVEEERSEFPLDPDEAGTMHRDQLTKSTVGKPSVGAFFSIDDTDVEELFKNKRDLKRLWNEVVDGNDLRSFWEGSKMKYFHSLSYYGSPSKGTDHLQTGQTDDAALQDLTAFGFFQMYDKTGNKDEMSTYGIYNNTHNIPRQQKKFGVLISGRVTLATMEDAFTESRSKASQKDIETHASSGMPKRIMPTDDKIESLLFEEADIMETGRIGECIIDNWSIDAIVCSPKMEFELKNSAKILAKQYGVPLLEPKDLGKKP